MPATRGVPAEQPELAEQPEPVARRAPAEQRDLAAQRALLPMPLAGRFAVPQPVLRPPPARTLRPHSAHLWHSAGAQASRPSLTQTARARECPANRAKQSSPPKRIPQSCSPPRAPKRAPPPARSRCQTLPYCQAPHPPPSAFALQAALPQKACVCVCRFPDRPAFNRPDVLAGITDPLVKSLSAPSHRVICRPVLRGRQSFGRVQSAHFAAPIGLMRRLR